MKVFLSTLFILITNLLFAQELYVFTEPASNMPAKSIGIRLNNEIMPAYNNTAFGIHNNNIMYRLNPEIMFGLNKKMMLHLDIYSSNMHQSNFKYEGEGVYLKYRFLSKDEAHRHFRMAAYIKGSIINNKIEYNDINLSGDNSGESVGIIATQLLHKLAVSFTGGYINGFNNLHDNFSASQYKDAFNYSLSLGYLTLPVVYKNYNQPNFNIYTEFLGKYNPESKEYYIDFAPAIQIIIKSKMRVDIGYRKQISGNMKRINNQDLIVKLEYNIFNAY